MIECHAFVLGINNDHQHHVACFKQLCTRVRILELKARFLFNFTSSSFRHHNNVTRLSSWCFIRGQTCQALIASIAQDTLISTGLISEQQLLTIVDHVLTHDQVFPKRNTASAPRVKALHDGVFSFVSRHHDCEHTAGHNTGSQTHSHRNSDFRVRIIRVTQAHVNQFTYGQVTQLTCQFVQPWSSRCRAILTVSCAWVTSFTVLTRSRTITTSGC